MNITKEYYAKCLDIDYKVFINQKGVYYKESKIRDKVLKGYSKPFLVYLYKDDEKVIVSYSNSLKNLIEKLKDNITLETSFDNLKQLFSDELFNVKHNYLYEFKVNKISDNHFDTRKLTNEDLHKFTEYFKLNNPDIENIDWLDNYFHDMCRGGFCYGTFENDKLVSIAECPDMPFMENKIRHIGISTLKGFTRNGYAKHTVIKSIENLLKHNIVPQWECSYNNEGSKKVAEYCGFKKIADCLILTNK